MNKSQWIGAISCTHPPFWKTSRRCQSQSRAVRRAQWLSLLLCVILSCFLCSFSVIKPRKLPTYYNSSLEYFLGWSSTNLEEEWKKFQILFFGFWLFSPIDRFGLACVLSLSLCNTERLLCVHWNRHTVATTTFKERCPSYIQMSRPLRSHDVGNGKEDFADV